MSTILSSASSPTGATLPPTQGWLTDPLDPTTAVPLRRLKSSGSSAAPGSVSFQDTTTEEMGIFYAFGRPNAIIQRGTIQAPTFTLSFLLYGYAERDALDALRTSGHVLLFRSDMGDAFYIVLGPDLTRSILRDSARVTNPLTAISVACTVTDTP